MEINSQFLTFMESIFHYYKLIEKDTYQTLNIYLEFDLILAKLLMCTQLLLNVFEQTLTLLHFQPSCTTLGPTERAGKI